MDYPCQNLSIGESLASRDLDPASWWVEIYGCFNCPVSASGGVVTSDTMAHLGLGDPFGFQPVSEVKQNRTTTHT